MHSLRRSFLKAAIIVSTVVFSTMSYADDVTLRIQRALSEKGYSVGTLDGIWGNRTRSALDQFLQDNGLEYDGSLDENDFQLLGIIRAPLETSQHSRTTLSPARNPQWHQYRDIIASPLRGLTVPLNFTLVDDWSSLMRVHSSRLTGNFDEASHFYATRIDFDKCVDDLSSTTSSISSRSGQEGIVPISAMCHAMLGERFNNDLNKYSGYYKRILLNWLDQSTLQNANRLQSLSANPNDYAYALQSNVAKVMAHYAVYHRL